MEEKKVPFIKKFARAFKPKYVVSKPVAIIVGISAFVILLTVWYLLTTFGNIDELFMPSPAKTFDACKQLFVKQGFLTDIRVTMLRVMIGFLIAAVIAVPVGIIIGLYSPIASFIEPIFSFVRYLPASAFIPLFILWIGIGENEKVAVIILGSLPQLVLMVANSVKNVSKDLIEVSYTLGTSKLNVAWKIILPKSAPHILDDMRIVLGWAWTYVVVAEMVGASSGIGYMIIQAQRMLNTSKIFVGILTIGLLGLAFDMLFKGLRKLLFPWA